MLYTKGLLTLAGILMLFVFIVGCCVLLEESKVPEEVVVEPEPIVPREVLPFTLVLDWYPNAVHAFLYTAVAKGFFAEQDLDVHIKFPGLTRDAIAMPVEGEADAGIYYMQDTIAAAVNTNIPVVSFGAVVQGDLNVIVTRQDSDIKGPEDFELKKIGFARSALSESTIIAIMDKLGVSVRECEFIDVGFDIIPALMNGTVDATIGNLINHDVPQLEAKGCKVNYVYPIDYGIPNQHELVFIANRNSIEENIDKYYRFVMGCKRGFEYVKENPDECLQLIIDNQIVIEKDEPNSKIELFRTVEEQSLEMLLPAMELVEGSFLKQETRIWQENADWMSDKNILESRIDISNLVVDLFDLHDKEEAKKEEEAAAALLAQQQV